MDRILLRCIRTQCGLLLSSVSSALGGGGLVGKCRLFAIALSGLLGGSACIRVRGTELVEPFRTDVTLTIIFKMERSDVSEGLHEDKSILRTPTSA